MLLENPGRPVNVYRELGITHCARDAHIAVWVHIRYLRRHGYVIVGSHDGTYTYHCQSGHNEAPRNGCAMTSTRPSR